MYLFDTDIVSLVKHGHRNASARVAATPPEQRFISVVTVEEVLRGCLADINASTRNISRLIAAHDRLQDMQAYLSEWKVLPFDHVAAHQCTDLLKRKVRVHTHDLRIAAIALSRGFTVVTANMRHFEKVPGLDVEDWTRTMH